MTRTMNFRDDIPEYTIDLAEAPSHRWDEVIASAGRDARALVKEAAQDFQPYRWLAKPFRLAYRASGGRYVAESDAWAKALGVDPSLLLLEQCSYELAQTVGWLGSSSFKIFGCTAGIVDGPKGPSHVRTLDWPLVSLAKATRVFHFTGEEHDFVVVGAAGFVGALSGMVPGAYSVTINYAPPCEKPGFDFGPAFLLREVLETCGTYTAAVTALRDTRLAAPVFFTVCGAKEGQGCIIERTREDAVVRRLPKGGHLVQANHFNGRGLTRYNDAVGEGEEESVFNGSSARQDALAAGLSRVRDALDFVAVGKALSAEPVTNEETGQQMIFHPASGEYLAWRRTA